MDTWSKFNGPSGSGVDVANSGSAQNRGVKTPWEIGAELLPESTLPSWGVFSESLVCVGSAERELILACSSIRRWSLCSVRAQFFFYLLGIHVT